MSKMRICAIAAALGLGTVILPAHALSIDSYLAFRDARDRSVATGVNAYLETVVDTLRLANIALEEDGRQKLYCAPANIETTTDRTGMAKMVLDRAIGSKLVKPNDNVGVALLTTLQLVYPCQR